MQSDTVKESSRRGEIISVSFCGLCLWMRWWYRKLLSRPHCPYEQLTYRSLTRGSSFRGQLMALSMQSTEPDWWPKRVSMFAWFCSRGGSGSKNWAATTGQCLSFWLEYVMQNCLHVLFPWHICWAVTLIAQFWVFPFPHTDLKQTLTFWQTSSFV